MNNSHRLLAAGVLASFAALVSTPASAQGVPPMKTDGAGGYVCGGIGIDQSTAFRSAMRKHPLSLLFARPNGDYLASVNVSIKGRGGDQAMGFEADGPVCLVDLPAGRYTVQATSAGVTKSRALKVGKAGSAHADFRFAK